MYTHFHTHTSIPTPHNTTATPPSPTHTSHSTLYLPQEDQGEVDVQRSLQVLEVHLGRRPPEGPGGPRGPGGPLAARLPLPTIGRQAALVEISTRGAGAVNLETEEPIIRHMGNML